MIRLARLRHGHTAWNRAGRIQGRTDIPLEPEAAAALSALRLPAPWSDAALWASPLDRAVETARLVGQRAPRVSDALLEMNWGAWEGEQAATLFQKGTGYRHIEDWGWHYVPPDGESPAAVRDRVQPWIDSLVEDSVAVCHIGVMRVILARATGWDFAGPAPFQIKRNRLYVIEFSQGHLRLLPDQPRLEPVAR